MEPEEPALTERPSALREYDNISSKSEKEYIPPKMEVLKQYSINIQFHDVGCTVQVGCKSVAFNTIESAMEAINTYVKDPFMEQQKWQKIFQQK